MLTVALANAGLCELVADADKRPELHDKITLFIEHNDAVLAGQAI